MALLSRASWAPSWRAYSQCCGADWAYPQSWPEQAGAGALPAAGDVRGASPAAVQEGSERLPMNLE